MAQVSVAVVQAEVAPTLAAGLELTRTLTLEAAAHGARLVVFPETWLPGYPAWLDVCRDVALWDHAPTKTAFAQYRSASEGVSPRPEALAEATVFRTLTRRFGSSSVNLALLAASSA